MVLAARGATVSATPRVQRHNGRSSAMHQIYSNQDLERLVEFCRARMEVLESVDLAASSADGGILGDFETYRVGNDLSVCTARGRTASDFSAIFEFPRGLFIGVVTQGAVRLQGGVTLGQETIRQGTGVVVWVSDAVEVRAETPADCAFAGLSIFLDETWFDRLEELAGDDPDDRRRIRQLSKNDLLEFVDGTPEISLLAAELTKSSCTLDLSARLHRESLTLDLIGGMLRPVLQRQQVFSTPLRRSDIEVMQRAQDILVSRLTDPPTLSSLSTELGINITKLKTQFPMVFGETVFEFTRSRQMALARQLLSGKFYNVSQIAFLLGYKSPANFSTAFRKYYGISPKELMR